MSDKFKQVISDNKLRFFGIIAISLIVITALITTAVVTILSVDAVAVIDTAAVLTGISTISLLASGMDKKHDKSQL